MEERDDTTYVASLSGGKDSIAMGLMLLERGYRVDDFVFCDTGFEFPECYAALDRFEEFTGRKITRLRYKHSLEYLLCDAPRQASRTQKTGSYIDFRTVGYGWPTMHYRWCTGFLKKNLARAYVQKYKRHVMYVGIAHDEPKRIRPSRTVQYPLNEWKVTEAECLAYCKARGFYPSPCAYDVVARMSCFICPLQNNKSIFYMIEHRPELWAEIKRLEAKCGQNWKVLDEHGTDYYDKRYRLYKSKPIQEEFVFGEDDSE